MGGETEMSSACAHAVTFAPLLGPHNSFFSALNGQWFCKYSVMNMFWQENVKGKKYGMKGISNLITFLIELQIW